MLGIRRRLVNMLNGLFERYKHIACSGHLNFKINVLPTRNMVCASQKTRLFEKFGREAFLDRLNAKRLQSRFLCFMSSASGRRVGDRNENQAYLLVIWGMEHPLTFCNSICSFACEYGIIQRDGIHHVRGKGII